MTSRGAKYWNSGSIPLIAPDLLGDIIAMASDLAIVISPNGLVLSVLVNPNNRHLAPASHWEGCDLRQFLTVESVPKLDERLRQYDETQSSSEMIELNHTEDAKWEFPIRYSLHTIGPDGTLLMLGRDLRPIAEMQQQLVKAQMALEKDYEVQREYDTRYRVLMDACQDAMIYVSLNTGRISDANAAAAQLLDTSRDALRGAAFAQEFEGRRRGELMESLTNVAIADDRSALEVQTRQGGHAVLIYPRIFRAAGDRLLLCRIEAMDGADDLGDALSKDLSGLYRDGVDAIVFTDGDGVIQTANESFLNLIDAAHMTGVKGKSLGGFLVRGSVDLKVLIENATRAGQMRMYATKLSSEFGGQVSVEISATYLNHRAHPVIVFVIRDVSRAEALRKPGVAVNDDAVRSVMEMVGSATLKDIVAETTDVVEKMCIETAVELTRNNRVAAAEMLGLSRQSLYVKLRKYGLLAKGAD
ncbi:transcriptional regulator PpsR [Actibacterium sp. 188UL27-1]|uniref:transcriptional regulator PpsR n=1 Tax=Actibacterium sp. 188UL27-1 TaxID=2786961 RepID=UPI0019588591|nr:transcriptional regulator PpsR [Actibacterium sp. 188UL27-1]MBM7068607.1 transcriptional regulator PpsR [Actibacterium sp. 188UL27-1]